MPSERGTMSEKLKPVKCGCGGEARVISYLSREYCKMAYYVRCVECGTETDDLHTEAEAVQAWNRAISGSAEEKLKAFWNGMSAEMRAERTAKVMNDGVNYCENCEGYVEAPMAYCPYCGCRLEWNE